MYKFSSFAQWPASVSPAPDAPFVIGVFDSDAVATELEVLVDGRTVGASPVVARRIRKIGPDMGLQILFIGKQDDARLRQLIARVTEPVLVVTDQEGALALGSVINLSTDKGRVRFSVSLLSAEARSIKLSARLLAVAQRVEGAAR